MFAIIKSQVKKSIKVIKMEVVQENNFSYYIFSVRNKDKINWIKLKHLLGDIKTRIILSDDIIPPEEAGIKPHLCERYAHKLTVNALIQILQNNSDILVDKSALLVDMHCKYQAYADVLVEYVKQLKVVTSKINFYNNYSNSKLYELGATVNVAHKPGKLQSDIGLIVSPSGVIFPCMEKVNTPIITALPIGYPLKSTVYDSFYEQPSALAQNIAKRVGEADNHVFLKQVMGALYEWCGERKLGQAPIGCCQNQKLTSIDNINLNSLDNNKQTIYNELIQDTVSTIL